MRRKFERSAIFVYDVLNASCSKAMPVLIVMRCHRQAVFKAQVPVAVILLVNKQHVAFWLNRKVNIPLFLLRNTGNGVNCVVNHVCKQGINVAVLHV